MRKIKFRGKSLEGKNKGEWVYGSYINPMDESYWIQAGGECEYEVDPETVGQFTGYKDKYGVDIYEDDKLLLKDKYGKREVTVKWMESESVRGSGIGFSGYEINSEIAWDAEVVGNTVEE